ncbi:hypothetical protein [Streptomyces sp. NPDC050856]|uniref:hypothetical protein n=1 Tax=Streptomyces sp. NPDC050856 TaxID=3154939 RepID=UPI0033DAE6E8
MDSGGRDDSFEAFVAAAGPQLLPPAAVAPDRPVSPTPASPADRKVRYPEPSGLTLRLAGPRRLGGGHRVMRAPPSAPLAQRGALLEPHPLERHARTVRLQARTLAPQRHLSGGRRHRALHRDARPTTGRRTGVAARCPGGDPDHRLGEARRILGGATSGPAATTVPTSKERL